LIGRGENLVTQNGSLEEDRTQNPIYYLDSIDVNQTITVALRSVFSPRIFNAPGLNVVPDSFEIKPKILNVDAIDNNAANNQTAVLKFLKSPNNELTISGCPSNVVVTAAVGATSAIATFGQPTGVSTALCGANAGITVIPSFPRSGQAFPIGVTRSSFAVIDGCNNLKTCAFTVTVNAQTNNLPDLLFNGYSGAFNYSGTPINWNFFSIKNNGSGTATAPFTLDAYLSTDSIFSPNDVLLGKTTFTQSLLQGQSVDVPKGNFLTPQNTPEGAYFVIYKLDGGNVVNEFLETNNTLFSTQNVYNPDVTVIDVSPTPVLPPNAPVTRGDQISLSDFRYQWVNAGGLRTDKFTTKFYFSRDTVLSADDYVIRTLTDSIVPFVQVDFPFNTSLVPSSFTSGTYYLIYQLDVDNVVFEKDETNNKKIFSINWNNGNATPLPDLTLANLTVGVPSVQQGQILNFNFDGKNIGTGAATGSFTIKSYLSTDQTLDASDYQNGTIPTANYAAGTNILQIGGAMSVSNAVAAGNYYLILKIDADNQIAESNENNNVIVSTGLINVSAVTSTNYCASKGVAPWEYAISNVQFGTINNTSDKFKDFSTLGYSDYTNLTTTLNKGQTYPLSITPLLSWIGNLPNAFARVWIDFNQNKTFEANELVLERTNANSLAQGVVIPTTALTGATRMRVSLKNGAYPTACETFDKGEVEDYTINITGGGTGGAASLQITNVTGATSGEPNGQLPVNITIQNTGGTASAPDSVFITSWRRQALYVQYYPVDYSKNRVAVPSIPAGQSVVVNANFTLPASLKTSILPDTVVVEPTIMLLSTYQFVSVNLPVPRTRIGTVSYFYPIQPSPQANLVLTGNQISATWDSVNTNIDLSLTIVNNGPNAAQNVFVKLHSTSIVNSSPFYFGSAITNFAITSGAGSLTRGFVITGSREEIGTDYTLWSLPTIPAGGTFTATFRGQVGGLTNIPQTATTNHYRDIPLRSYIINADVTDSNRSNDSLPTYIFRNVRAQPNNNLPDLTVSNLTVPNNNNNVQQGQVLNFNADFKNIGAAAVTGNFTVKSYLSTDDILSADDYQDGSITTGNYAAGFSVLQVPAAMTVRNTLATGTYFLILKIDADNQVTEANENNNTVVWIGGIVVTAPTGGGSDIALTMTTDPSVYRAYTTQNFRISAKNNSTTAFTNVKIKFTRPTSTVSGGTKVASIGTFQDYCPGGIECSEWTIPSLAGGATATLDAPIFVLAPTGAITATATLLSSTPTDNVTANNTATVSVNPSTAPIVQPLIQAKPTQLVPIVIQKISPTITENYIIVELESTIEKTIDMDIVNSLGINVLNEKITVEKGTNKKHFDVSSLPKGLYFIQTSVGKGRNVPTKFIKM
jgi:subtilase family serine protease